MAGEWTIRLGGSSGLVIDKTKAQGREVKFVPSRERVVNDKGDTEGYRVSFEIEGNVISTTESDVADKYINLEDEITNQGARQFEALLDGTAKWSIQPPDCFWGPYVMRVEAVDDEGNGGGHWRYRFVVAAFVKKTSGFDIDTSLEVKKDSKGNVVAKIWRAKAKAASAAAATSAILAFKPGGTEVTQDLIEHYKRAESEAEWVWSAAKTAKNPKSWKCEVLVTSGKDYIVDKQASGAPVLHEVREDVTVVEIKGRIVSTDPVMVGPVGHYTASDKIKRARDQGMLEAAVLDKEDGTYYIDYHELWFIEGPPPKPNHEGGHNVINAETPPGNGGIAA